MGRPPRLENFDYVGLCRYFLTFCSEGRARILTEQPVFQLVAAQLRSSAEGHGMAVDAYCVMPDHVHLLARGMAENNELRPFMKDLKQRTGYEFGKASRGRLWQRDYYEHVLREEDDDAGVIAYIVNNPLRAGLVGSPQDYLYWGSLEWTREQILDFIADIPEWEPPYGRQRRRDQTWRPA
jgi:putative transposase